MKAAFTYKRKKGAFLNFKMKNLILASASPRRRELLTQAGLEFLIDAADVDERIALTDPEEYVKELSRRKAEAVRKRHSEEAAVVLGADTVVVCDGAILGKPVDEKDAFRMLSILSGRAHDVFTGVTLLSEDDALSFAERTQVVMYDNSEELLRDYIATGEPFDKAGGYGIQGRGTVLVREIHGDYNNVVGLPVARVIRALYAML